MDFRIDYNGLTKTPEKVYLNIGYNNFKQQSTYDLFSQIVLPINKEVFLVSENLWMCLRTHDKSQFDMINEVFNKMYEKDKKNASTAFAIGNCYMNTQNEKPRAIPYFEAAKEKFSAARSASLKESCVL